MSFDIPDIKGLPDHLEEMFSAAYFITHIANELDELKKDKPEGSQLLVIMQTPEGDFMRVLMIKPLGFQCFSAIGKVGGLPRAVIGHIASLSLSCTFETLNGESEQMEEIQFPESVH